MSEIAQRFSSNPELIDICKRSGISYLALFGSSAREETDENSDIDLLYRFNKKVTYFEFYDILESLKQLFGREIDAISINHIKKNFFNNIKNDIELLYED